MKRKIQNLIIAVFIASALACAGQDQDTTSVKKNQELNKEKNDTLRPIITFVELGSVNCIPCKKMQPVMKAIEEKYGDQIEVVFYDVWKPEQRKYAKEYGIRLIPTQVFLNQEGIELYRHEGFFPEESIDKFFREQGISPKEKS